MNPRQLDSTRSHPTGGLASEDTLTTRAFVSEIKGLWRHGVKPDAQAVLQQNPEIRRSQSLVLDLAYEEYCLKTESGEPIDVEAFCRRFPSISRQLDRQIGVHQYLLRHPGLLTRHDRVRWPDAGETLFGFTVVEELGRGAFARVYLCSQAGVGDRQVVVKLAYQGAYEAETLGRLTHPNIVPVYSVVEDEQSGVSGICMPFRGRSTLCDVLDLAFDDKTCPSRAGVILEAAETSRADGDQYDRVESASHFPWSGDYVDGVIFLGIQLAEALQHAHGKGILHGDLKPSNVLITPGGTPMLLDFNLSLDRQSEWTMPGGTLPYMSPEQIRSMLLDPGNRSEDADERTDIFSLATILYELLCGRLPFGRVPAGPSTRQTAETLLDRCRRGPAAVRAANPAVDPSLAKYIERCLCFDPETRPASMAELAGALRRHLSVARRARRWARGHRHLVAAAALLFAIFLIGGTTFLISREPYGMRQYKRAMEHFDHGQFKPAIACLSRAVEEDPEFAEAFYQRGRARLQNGDWRLALQDFVAADEIREDGRYAASLAYTWNRLKDHSRAIFCYEKAIRAGYETPEVYNNLGCSYFKKRSYERAEACLDRAIQSEMSSHVPYLNRALIDSQRALSDPNYFPDAGIADIRQAMEKAPDSAFVHVTAAILYACAARQNSTLKDEAIQLLETCVDLGVARQTLTSLRVLGPFRDDPRFERLISRCASTGNPPAPDLLLDPVSEDRADKLR